MGFDFFLYNIMPEGVEVKLMLEKLKKLHNQPITQIKIYSGKYTRHGKPLGFNLFRKNLPLLIKNIQSKGKFIYISLSNNWFILLQLGMAGKLITKKNREKHDHIEFTTPKYNLYFHDIRNFGNIQFTNKKEILEYKLQKLGYDPLQDNITLKQFTKHIQSFFPYKRIGSLLLEQNFISGIGNYLRADILYCAKIHPEKEIGSFTKKNIKKLLECIKKTMLSSYQKQKNKDFKFIIYKQDKSPKGNPISKYKDNKGRTMWFVEKEQFL